MMIIYIMRVEDMNQRSYLAASSSSSSSSWHRLHLPLVPPQRPPPSSPRPSSLPLDSNKETQDLLGLDHVVLIHLELVEDVVDLSLGHLVSPGHQGVLEHLDVDLAFVVVGSEGLDDEIIGIVAVYSHLVLEHVDHALEVAGTSNLSRQIVQLRLRHEDTDVVEGSAE